MTISRTTPSTSFAQSKRATAHNAAPARPRVMPYRAYDTNGRGKRQPDEPSSSSLQEIYSLLRTSPPPGAPQAGAAEPRFQHRRFKSGELIYRMGQTFSVLYIVRLGFLKTILRNIQGAERILSFPMQGDLLGFDGIYHNRYTNDTIALTDGDLIAIPFKELLATGHCTDELGQMIYLAASREIMLERCGMGLSITVQSEARVARFLAMQAKRYTDMGYSSRNFLLPMTRRDLGSYLGLTLETISRSLSALANAGVIAVNRRDIRILQPEMLTLPADFPPAPERLRKTAAVADAQPAVVE
ncbi:MAG: cyclic nucleotide-binding domain-containing protein [Candidimonas sp.]|nr:MAG: cyclic nucleotide-binding domain-containing protein [Candidimonas sp.]